MCPLKILWRLSPWPLNISPFASLPFREWTKIILDPKLLNFHRDETHNFQLFAIIAMDSLWFLQNQVIHNHPCQTPTMFSNSVKFLFNEHQLMWTTKNNPPPTIPEWTLPPEGHSSLSYDVAVRNKFFTTEAICRSSTREIIYATTQTFQYVNPTFGEAMAAKLAIEEATRFNLTDIIIEGDNQVVTNAIPCPTSSPD